MKLILIDGNNQAHKAYHAYKNLTYKGESVSIMYGFISMLRAVVNNHHPDKVVISWDHQRSPHRLAIHQEYKGTRDTKKEPTHRTDREDLNRQIAITMAMCDSLGIIQLYGDKMEGDDYLYLAYRRLRKKYSKIQIISSDKDFNQLLDDPKVSILNTSTRVVLDRNNCLAKTGYAAEETVCWLSLVGDTSDNIPGYPGIGPANARKFLDAFGSIQAFLQEKTNNFPKIDNNKLLELHEKNRILVDLPFFYEKYIKGVIKPTFFSSSRPILNQKVFLEFCRKYNFHSFLHYEFIKPFIKLKLKKP